jgi:hypothetical protein
MPKGSKGPSPVVRQSGGMRQSFGDFDSERMEGQAVQSAVSQKKAQQKGSSVPTNKTGQSAQQQQGQAQPPKPREVGSLWEELFVRPLSDIKDGLKSFFDLNSLMGINPEQDTPEEIAKKREMHRRYQQLTEAEQQEAKKKYELRMKQKQEEEKQKELKRQQIEEQKKASIAPPSGKNDKPGLFVGGKSGKARAQNRLQQQMKTMGTVTDGG